MIDSTAIISIVDAAFFDSGGRNAGTPFDTASTPVIAVQPLENAVSSRNSVSGWNVDGDRLGDRQRLHRAADDVPRAEADERQRGDDEEVRRDREDVARFANAAQIADHQQQPRTRASARRG